MKITTKITMTAALSVLLIPSGLLQPAVAKSASRNAMQAVQKKNAMREGFQDQNEVRGQRRAAAAARLRGREAALAAKKRSSQERFAALNRARHARFAHHRSWRGHWSRHHH